MDNIVYGQLSEFISTYTSGKGKVSDFLYMEVTIMIYRSLPQNRPVRDRAIVISAGVIANCIFAFGILFTQVQGLLYI